MSFDTWLKVKDDWCSVILHVDFAKDWKSLLDLDWCWKVVYFDAPTETSHRLKVENSFVDLGLGSCQTTLPIYFKRRYFRPFVTHNLRMITQSVQFDYLLTQLWLLIIFLLLNAYCRHNFILFALNHYTVSNRTPLKCFRTRICWHNEFR